MNKQLLSYFIVFVVLFSVLSIVPKTEAQKRCIQELEQGKQCLLAKCRERCFKNLNGFGSCVEKPPGSDRYICNCFYSCGAQ
ncbi:PREDICTED: putative defensin-like protein 165 [Camelina sativa]|uniref:Defensin-like protein 165 n=1 Tax=Camelina sativa TaxID=90675 RepID=A0ABM1QLG2_CAMSA|nr:PREDICTED: putative defensin-like protein 165 [Camelina sativa]XP_019087600.1 PREDICTED: putative defensin-like protein 165 [Camelina sativa]